MTAARERLVRAIRGHTDDAISRSAAHGVIGVVKATGTSAGGLKVHVPDHDFLLDADDLLVGQAVGQFDEDYGLAVGDSMLLVPLGQGDYVAVSVLTTTEPTKRKTSGGANAHTGPPGPTDGDDGDFSIDPATGSVYGPKTGGVWPTAPLPFGGGAGLRYIYSSDTTLTDPTSGKVKFDNATLASVASVRISETDRDGTGLAAWIATWDDSTTTGHRGTLIVTKEGAPSNVVVLDVTSAETDAGAWDSFTVGVLASNGAFADGDQVRVLFIRTGDAGATGGAGPTGPTGPAGPTGGAGSNFLTGHGVPGAGLGNNGDSYLDIDSGLLYTPKAAGVWPAGVQMVSTVVIGAMFDWPAPARSIPAKYLACFGQSLLRATYPALFAALCPLVNTATVTLASPGVFTTPAAHGLVIGDPVFLTTTGALPTGMAANTTYYVMTAPSGTTFTLGTTRSVVAATGIATVTTAVNTSTSQSGVHSVFQAPHGVADSTHFNLPDFRGRGSVGKDTMGGSPASNLLWTPVDGLTAGEAAHLLLSSESGLPTHQHTPASLTNFVELTVGGANAFSIIGGTLTIGNETSTGGVTGGAVNAGASHNNVPPGLTVEKIIFAGV